MAKDMEQVNNLRYNFDAAVTAYEKELCERWGITDGYWVAGDRYGIFCFFNEDNISLGEMIYIVENDLSYDEYAKWRNYNIKASEYKFHHINIQSWHLGCPRVPQETFDRLDNMRKNLEEACKEVRENF